MIDFSKLEMAVSRTEQKKSHERLQQLAELLATFPKKKWQNLPVSEYFLAELNELANIKSAAAKNRQIKRVGKLMVDENRHELVAGMFALAFDTAQIAKIMAWQNRLSLSDNDGLKQFIRQYNASEYNTLYQLLLWIEYAKHQNDDELLAESVQDFESYIKEVAILSD